MPDDRFFSGQAFCFLPLGCETRLPNVHVHGNFALTSNRRGLWRRGAADADLLGVRHRFSVSFFRFVLQFPEACLQPGPVLAVSKNW